MVFGGVYAVALTQKAFRKRRKLEDECAKLAQSYELERSG